MNLTDYFEDLKSVRISGPPPVPAGKFSQDPGCGVSKGCFSNCENQVCDWESSWEEQGSDYRIVLRSTFSADNKYLSLGFNSLLGKMVD
ncbi:uncharacterized protein LOC101848216 [Aplysia californica]|uniref:Uncharacterized protein LOC101848216 n=1 Tax=Aplysia californica TaxID=6500 RepID=A0ABM1A4C4_APLCA|nr:uncharacterized protein LOC101848216 [Aplysia californica]